jgi:hypothetical protein
MSYNTFTSEEWSFLTLRIKLSDTKDIKARQVYGLFELISEVSGFADIVVVTVSLFISFYTAES